MLAGIVNHIYSVHVRTSVVEAESEVCILNDDTESLWQWAVCRILVGAPEHKVVTREVEVAVEEVHHHHVQKLADINPLLIFCQRMAFFTIEGLESLVELCSALFEFFDKQVFIVDILM